MNHHSCPQCLTVFDIPLRDPFWKLALMAPGSLLGAQALKSPWGLLLGAGIAFLAHELLVEINAKCPECGVALRALSPLVTT